MKTTLFALSFAVLATTVYAQAPQPDFSKVEIKTTKISNNFYTLEGQGGTIGVLVGPDGIFMVDSQFAPLSEKIAAAIRQISDKPIRFMVNTHVHPDHTGGNANFAKMGATIFSRDELRWRLAHPLPAAGGAPGVAAPAEALPVVTYEGPVTVHMDGEEVHLVPIHRAHTDGDTLVHFESNDVLMTGDYFRSLGFPNIDRANGGSLDGMLEGLGITIGMAGPHTKIIPGHGVTVDRAGLIAHRDMILAVRDKVAAMEIQTNLPAFLKVGPNTKMNEIVHAHLPGVPIVHLPTPPPQIRAITDHVYFYLDRTSPLWPEFSRASAIGLHFAGDWPELEMELWAVREDR